MTIALELVSGFVLLYLGAESLIRGAAGLALRFGLTPLVVGLTVVAFGTSSAELAVCLGAAFRGFGDIAVGNVVGSNICNVALILGLAALIQPVGVKARLIRFDVPIVIASSLAIGLWLLDGVLERLEGVVLTAGIVAYVWSNLRLARTEAPPIQEEFSSKAERPQRSLFFESTMVGGGLVALALGANFFVDGAVAGAEQLGISRAVVGLTVVALGTSLPEVATCVVGALRGQGDIAIGSVVGSNVFNLLAILGLTALVHPIRSSEVSGGDLGVMIALAVVLLPLMRTGFLVNRWEGGLLVASYPLYLVWRTTLT